LLFRYDGGLPREAKPFTQTLTRAPLRRTLAPTMPAGFDAAFARVKALVADFRANEKFYLFPAYQEQEARRDFIDKFWLALGWDVNHETQKNPFEQEVKVERKEHGFSQRRADYAFYLAPNFRDVKFYVEAKKPHGDIATADNYFQTARYGWSSSTPVAVLHDFEQFEIVDCDGLDRQIDALVYDLYALTPAEIKIVEGAVK
jgi:hypothetical protein